MDIKPHLKITRKTINNKRTRIIIREAIVDFIEILLEECPLTFNESISIVSGYYNIDEKVVKYLLKGTKFDNDIVCIIVDDEGGKKFLTHCEYIFLIYKTIHKIIVKLFLMNDKKVSLIKIIIEMVKVLNDYHKSSALIVFNAIKNELKKRASKYKNFYKRYLPSKILKGFDNINNPCDFSFDNLKNSNDIPRNVWLLKNNFYKSISEISVILEIEVGEVEKYI